MASIKIASITPEDLESLGYQIRFVHLRAISSGYVINRLSEDDSLLKTKKQIQELRKEGKNFNVLSTGGKTICRIFLGEEMLSEGFSVCHPIDDNFDRKTGRLKSFGRAIQRLKLEHNEEFQELLKDANSLRIRPKLNTDKSRKISLDRLCDVIEDIEMELFESDSTIKDINCEQFVERLLDKLNVPVVSIEEIDDLDIE